MDTMPANDPMQNPPQIPLGGLDPVALLRQGAAEDTLAEDLSSPFTPPSLEDLASLFPQFEILALIGQGGMGAVYKVRQKDLDRIVALKILPPAIGRSPEFSARFTREARALAKLNHPGIVTIHEFGQQDGLYFFLMEFVDGVSLAQLMKSGRVSAREALAIVPQICDALQYAHDQGIVHRDIKPENILLDRQGRVKVADFGIAKVVAAVCDRRTDEEDVVRQSQTDATLAGKIIGTPAYMAPEQIEHPSDVDHRADIYALGVVFYQMLTGELPDKELQAPSRKVHIDVRLDEIVLQAMEKNPELRFQQASVMKTRMDDLGSEPVVPLHPAEVKYAGFWKRLLAFFIDYILVSLALFPFVVSIASIAPDSVVVSVPFGLFTTEHTLESNQTERKNADGSTTAVEQRIVEVTVLGKWKYLYRDEIARSAGNEEKSRQLIDPVSRKEFHTMTAERLVAWILMIYWILMESSSCQASIGKLLVGIRVVDSHGGRIGIARSAARNISKLLSAVTLMIGFLMAGWTRKKQALHDIVSDCNVTISPMWARVSGVVSGEAEKVIQTPKPMQTQTTGRLIAIGCGVLGLVGILLMVALVTASWFFTMKKHEAFEPQLKETRQAEANSLERGAPIPAEAASLLDGIKTIHEEPDFRGKLESGKRDEMEQVTKELARRWNRLRELLKGTEGEALIERHFDLSQKMAQKSMADGTAPERGMLAELQQLEAELDRIAKRTDVSKTASMAVNASTEPPQLRALDWQDRLEDCRPSGDAWLPSGEPLVSPEGMPAITAVVDKTEAARENSRFLCLWFSHPHFDKQSMVEIKLLDSEGKQPLKTPTGNFAISAIPASPENADTGWITATLCAGKRGDIPPGATVFLRYSVGAWQFWNDIAPDFNGTQALGTGVMMNRPAQGADGHAFIQITRDSSQDTGVEQFGFVAITRDGRRLETTGYGKSSSGKVTIERFPFDVPLAQVKFFECRKRPIHQITWQVALKESRGTSGLMKIDPNRAGDLFLMRERISEEFLKRKLENLKEQNPDLAVLVETDTGTIPERAAVASAEAWLARIDAGNYAQSWKDAARLFQTTITEADWSETLKKFRKPLGEMKSRKLLDAKSAKSLPGAPDGEYVVMQFETSFAAKEKAVETVTFMKEPDGTWKAAGYFIK